MTMQQTIIYTGRLCNAMYIYVKYCHLKGTAVAQRLRCCATNWKVTGSIPGGVIGIFL